MQKQTPTVSNDQAPTTTPVTTQAQDEQTTLGNGGVNDKLGGDGGGDADPAVVAREVEAARFLIQNACAGWGTDEQKIFDTLKSLSPDAKAVVRADKEIIDLLISELSRSELQGVHALLGTSGDKKVDQLSSHLGQATDFPGIAGAVGGFLTALAPFPGRVFAAKIGIDFVPLAGLFGLGLDFEIEGERLEDGFELKVGLKVFVGFKGDVGIFEAKVGANITAEAETKANDAAMCLEMIGLGLYGRITAWLGKGPADLFFDQLEMQALRDKIDPDPGEAPTPPPDDADEEAKKNYEAQKAAFDEQKKNADSVSMSFGITGGAEGKAESGKMGGTELGAEMGWQRSWETTKDGKSGEMETVTKDWFVFKQKLVLCGYGLDFELKANNKDTEIKVKGVGKVPLHGIDGAILAGAVQQVVGGILQLSVAGLRLSGHEKADAVAAGLGNLLGGASFSALNTVPAMLLEQGDPTHIEGELENELELEYTNSEGKEHAGLALKLLNVIKVAHLPVGTELEYKTGQKVELL